MCVRGRFLGFDELAEPPHLAFGTLKSVLLKLQGVGIDTLTTSRHGLAKQGDSFLKS